MRASLPLGVSLLLACCAAPSGEPAPEPPRGFVLFVVDDLGWTDIGSFGSSFYDTPNVDRLAAEGMRFTQAYAACPVCSPTRAALMTGRHPVRVGITDYISPTMTNQPELWKRDTPLLPASFSDRLAHDEETIAETLGEAGYATFFAGKWHLGPEGWWPEDQGFDENQGGIERGGPYGGKKYFSPYGNPRLADGPDGEHLPARLAAETVAFLEENRDRPFLAVLSFYSVHTPLIARDDLRAKYDERRAALGAPGDADEAWGKERRRKVRLVQDHAVYGGMVEAMDQAVGRVLDALDELGLAEDTVVLFTSDNGGLSTSEGHPTSNLPLRAGKGWMYEGGIRVPTIARWPDGIAAGSVCDAPMISMDVAPTLVELAGLPPRPDLHADGSSLVPLLRGDERSVGPLVWHYPHYGNQGGAPSSAIRVGDSKLVEWLEDGRVELYDLAADPGESRDLAGTHPARRDELLALLRTWRTLLDAPMPTRRTGR